MIKSSEFFYPSRDGKTKIRAREWYSDDSSHRNPIAVLQIIHGIAEHIDRYDGFASYLASLGYLVVGHDILGHGKSISEPSALGCFADENGWFVNIEDIDKLRSITSGKYPDAPYFMLGHSMGSFLLRTYISIYAEGLSGAIISGTGYTPGIALAVGSMLAKREIRRGGIGAKSEALRKLCFGNYNKKIPDSVNGSEWLSRDNAVSEKYVADPLCGFLPSANTYNEMFNGIKYVQTPKNIFRIPSTLPIFFLSGECDPVGNYSKGVKRVRSDYIATGNSKIKMKLYPGGRHEMLNETNREEVYKDISGWLSEILSA